MAEGKLARRMNNRIAEMVRGGRKQGDIVARLASAAGITESTVNQILQGSIKRPPDNRLRGFARVLNIGFDQLRKLAGEAKDFDPRWIGEEHSIKSIEQ